MKKYLAALVLLICAIIIATPIQAADQPQAEITPIQDYVIGPGDVLNISVWNNEALTRAVTATASATGAIEAAVAAAGRCERSSRTTKSSTSFRQRSSNRPRTR